MQRWSSLDLLHALVACAAARAPACALDASLAALKQCEAKLAEMFEDCLEDLMEQLWGALQYAGSARSQDALASSQHTVEQLKDMAQAAQAGLLERDAALAAARSHAAEQAALLDTACQRRDHEVAAARKLEATVAELVAVLGADAGLSVRQWLAVTEAAKGSGLQPGEALDGECGLAKALL
ncbi:hypothetical protein HaLaN_29867, partial [Haematococcus lacustris]